MHDGEEGTGEPVLTSRQLPSLLPCRSKHADKTRHVQSLTSLKAAEAMLARSRGDNRDALTYAIRAAELYMAAAGEAPSKSEAARLRRRCQELILYAEKLKAQQATPSSSSAQPEILRRASRLHGNDFPPWEADPLDGEFDLRPGEGLFTLVSGSSRPRTLSSFSHQPTQEMTPSSPSQPPRPRTLPAGRGRQTCSGSKMAAKSLTTKTP